MPSQEDFLDDLLKDLTGQDEDFATIEGLDDIDIDAFFGVDETQNMSEEDIDRVLSEKQETAQMNDLAQQSNNNESVDDDIIALLQSTSAEEVELLDQAVFDEEEEAVVESEEQIETKSKLSREERKAEKAALREAKKAAKAAKKKSKKNKDGQEMENQAASKSDAGDSEMQQENQAADLSDIDELLSMAGNTIQSSGSKDVKEENANPQGKKNTGKKSVFTKVLDFLTEEDEDEEAEKKKGNENIQLSDENKTVIDELDKEKKKKKKGKKDKKNKKGDVKEASEGEAEEGAEEGAEEKKAKKPKKEKKAKKEKLPVDLMMEQGQKGPKLSSKKIMPIVLVCLSLGIIIVFISNLAGDYSAKKAGREAYYNNDYETAYQNFFGKELNESELVMYSKSESILRIHLWIREYEMFAEEGAEAEALDSLIQSVNAYPVLYEYAAQWNAGTEVSESYAQILSILSEKYHLTETQALEIAAVADDAEYSKLVYAIIDGEEYGSGNQTIEEPEVLQDVLPEEEELEDVSFVDNNN